jgi:hypothetical protein
VAVVFGLVGFSILCVLHFLLLFLLCLLLRNLLRLRELLRHLRHSTRGRSRPLLLHLHGWWCI